VAGERVLVVQSGRAFPPGHPTTRLCLDLLRRALAGSPVDRLLDLGCGAGVLSLAAAALGVPRVLGVDLFRAAARITRCNARHSRLDCAIRTVQGSTECLKAGFNLVAANLPWEVQLEKLTEINRLTAAGGGLILSGFRDNQEEHLLKGYRNLGWRLNQRSVRTFSHPQLPPDISFTWVAWWLVKKAE